MQFGVFLLWFVASASYLRDLCQFLDHGGLLLCSPLEVLWFQLFRLDLSPTSPPSQRVLEGQHQGSFSCTRLSSCYGLIC